MATQNTRDVELRISATTSGDEQIRLLAQQLQALAKEGGDAAPEFQRLAGEIQKIAEQTKAVQTIETLQTEIEQTGTKVAEAAGKVERLGTAFQEQAQKTDAFRQNQSEARAAVEATEQKLRAVQGALNVFRASQDSAAKSTDEYKARVVELRTEVASLENQLKDQKALVSTRTEVREVEKALKDAAKAYEAAKAEAAAFEAEVSKQKAALDSAQQALAKTGVTTTDIAKAQEQIKSALTATRTEIDKQATSFAEAKAEAEAFAAVGVKSSKSVTEEINRINAALDRLKNDSNVSAADLARAFDAAQERIKRLTGELNQATAAQKAQAAAAQQAAQAAQAQANALKQQADAAGKALDEAFGKTGVRSAQAIQKEIDDIIAALAKLRTDSSVTGADFDRAFASAQGRLQKLQGELNGLPDSLNKTGKSTEYVTAAFRQFAAIYGGIELGTQFIQANVQLETLRRSLTLVTGSTQAAAQQIELLRTVANTSGISIGEISSSFVKFQAALNGANVPLETTESLFRAVVNASGQLGLSSQKTSLILDALAQTANKGVVSMEELRQQLGDSLPGALDLTAKGLGITTSELVTLVENGRLLSADFLPALRDALVNSFGDGTKSVEGLGASIARFKNQLTELAQAIGDSGGGAGLIAALKGLGIVAGAIGVGLNTIFGTLATRVRQLGTVIAAIATRDFKNLRAELSRIEEENIQSLANVAQKYRDFVFESDKVAVSQKKTTDAVVETGKAVEQSAVSFQTSSAAQLAAAGAATKNAAAQTAAGAAAKTAGDAAGAAGNQWVQLSVQYEKDIKLASEQIKVSETLAAAKRLEGQARQEIADIAGNEAEKVRVAAEAKTEEAAALARVAEARKVEVSLLEAQRSQLQGLITSLGDAGGARTAEIEKINQAIAAKGAEAEKAAQAAQALQREALARQTAVRTYTDNSAALQTLATAYDTAQKAVVAAEAALSKGVGTAEQVTGAKQRAAVAEALYRDAVADTTKNLDANIRLQQAKLAVTEGQIGVEKLKLQNEIETAKAMGQSALVLEKTIQLKELDIKVIQAKNVALAAEARAAIQAAENDKQSLIATNALTEVKKKEIEARILAAKAKLLEVDRNGELIKGFEREIELMRIRGQVSSDGANRFVADRGKEVSALDRVKEASEKAAEAERKRLNVDKEGFTLDRSGNRLSMELPTWLSIFNQLKGRGLPDDAARSIANEFVESNGNVQNFNNQAQLKYGGAGSTIGFAVDRAAEKYLRNASEGGPVIPQSAFAPQAQVAPVAQAPSQVYTVNINLGGRTTAINTASDADAQALTSLLQSLGNSASRTGP